MMQYEGMNENDWKVIQIAIQKLQITGAEAPMVANLLRKVEMETELLKVPKQSRPKAGDVVQKENPKK